MVAGWPVRMPNWLKMWSRMTANQTQSRICFVKSFKFHLQPQLHYDKNLADVPEACPLTGPPELTPSQTAAPTDGSQGCAFVTPSAFWSPPVRTGRGRP